MPDASGNPTKQAYYVRNDILDMAKIQLGLDTRSSAARRYGSTSKERLAEYQRDIDRRAMKILNEKFPRMPMEERRQCVGQGFEVVSHSMQLLEDLGSRLDRTQLGLEMLKMCHSPLGWRWLSWPTFDTIRRHTIRYGNLAGSMRQNT